MPVRMGLVDPNRPWANYIPGTTAEDDPPASKAEPHANFIPATPEEAAASKKLLEEAAKEDEINEELRLDNLKRRATERKLKAEEERLKLKEEVLNRKQSANEALESFRGTNPPVEEPEEDKIILPVAKKAVAKRTSVKGK